MQLLRCQSFDLHFQDENSALDDLEQDLDLSLEEEPVMYARPVIPLVLVCN